MVSRMQSACTYTSYLTVWLCCALNAWSHTTQLLLGNYFVCPCVRDPLSSPDYLILSHTHTSSIKQFTYIYMYNVVYNLWLLDDCMQIHVQCMKIHMCTCRYVCFFSDYKSLCNGEKLLNTIEACASKRHKLNTLHFTFLVRKGS